MDTSNEDLKRGVGEWRNLQEVVRKEFLKLHETIASQQEEIGSLTNQLATLRSELRSRPSGEEISRLVDTKIFLSRQGDKAQDLRGDLDAIRSELRSDFAKKSAVEEALLRKVDRNEDALLKAALKTSTESQIKDMALLKNELGKLHAMVEPLTLKLKTLEKEKHGESRSIMHRIESLQAQFDETTQHPAHFEQHQHHHSKTHHHFVDKAALEHAILGKADKTSIIELEQKIHELGKNVRDMDTAQRAAASSAVIASSSSSSFTASGSGGSPGKAGSIASLKQLEKQLHSLTLRFDAFEDANSRQAFVQSDEVFGWDGEGRLAELYQEKARLQRMVLASRSR